MRAARLHDFSTDLQIDTIDLPELTADDDVIIRVAGSGLCRTDIHLIDGALLGAIPDQRPVTLGHETSGWVEAVGRSGSELAPGQPVLLYPIRTCGTCPPCRRGSDMFCEAAEFTGLWADGGFADYVKTSVRALVPLPQGIDPIDWAPYADAGVTVMRAVKKAVASLPPTGLAVIIGAGGGLGHLAVQLLAKMSTATILAVDISPEALSFASQLGAEHAALPTEAAIAAAELSAGKGADVVLDFVGENGSPDLSVTLLGQAGTYLIVGYGADLRVPTGEIVIKEIRIEGVLVGTQQDLVELTEIVGRGGINLHTRRYELDQINTAVKDLRAGMIRGRGVIVPSSS